MVKEIVFHLGDCKTGTTSIQSVLASGAWKTPTGILGGDITYPTRFNHMNLAKTLSVEAKKPFEEKHFSKLRKAFDTSDATYGVISAEHFEFVDPALVKSAIERHLPEYVDRMRFVAYVRPHADRLVSTFAERTKKGLFYKSLTAMHDKLALKGTLFYTPRFEKWRALFGDNFTLRPFVRDRLYHADVVHDFFYYLFDSDEFEITQPTEANESLSVEDIAMLRAIHRHLRKNPNIARLQQQNFGWYMSDFLTSTPGRGDTRPRLHEALAQQVVDVYRADARDLDASFFDDNQMEEALSMAKEKSVAEEQSFKAVDHYHPMQMRHFKVWAQMLMRLMLADPDHFSWAMRPPELRGPNPSKSKIS